MILTPPVQVEILYPFSCFTGELLQNSECHKLKYQDQEASLTVSCAHKEDEGFYTLRVPLLDGYKEQTTYVFVRGIIRMLSYLEQKVPFLIPWHKGFHSLILKKTCPSYVHGYN